MRIVYYDIETTGLDIAESAFKCGVVIVESVVHPFTDAVAMATFLTRLPATDTVVTFNGLAFDYQFLAFKVKDVPGLSRKLAQQALTAHVDIMYAFLCTYGYFASMQSFATPLGIAKSWSGAEAADSTDTAAVLAYCEQDVRVLQTIFEASVNSGVLHRLSTNNRRTTWVLPQLGIPDVATSKRNCAQFSPDQSWMDNPPTLLTVGAWTNTYV